MSSVQRRYAPLTSCGIAMHVASRYTSNDRILDTYICPHVLYLYLFPDAARTKCLTGNLTATTFANIDLRKTQISASLPIASQGGNMRALAGSPVQDVTFGQALSISLDNYYDLLKKQVGGLKADEYLQLKLVADTIDISKEVKASEHGYVWFSYFNILSRSDRAIQPTPISGELQVGLESLADAYGKFVRKLRSYVVLKELSPEDQRQIDVYTKQLEGLNDQVTAYYISDRKRWKDIAEAMGWDVTDQAAYAQWSGSYGHLRDIERVTGDIKAVTFRKNSILNRKYKDPDDQAIVDAEFDFDNPAMRLRFPLYPDYQYAEGDRFNPTYLSTLPLGNTALFEDRRVVTIDKTLTSIKVDKAGSFTATFDKQTQKSTSITTDWSASGSGGYGFISVSASVSEHKQIQEDFRTGTTLALSADAALRINLAFPTWFRPTLFTHKYVMENPFDFENFFNAEGSLLYYPTALIVVRGFAVEFVSSKKWTYDYERKFSASGGGGFSAFGYSFGAKGSYSSDQKEHQIDQSETKLKISDDAATVRFVGYAVKKNDVLAKAVAAAQARAGFP